MQGQSPKLLQESFSFVCHIAYYTTNCIKSSQGQHANQSIYSALTNMAARDGQPQKAVWCTNSCARSHEYGKTRKQTEGLVKFCRQKTSEQNTVAICKVYHYREISIYWGKQYYVDDTYYFASSSNTGER